MEISAWLGSSRAADLMVRHLVTLKPSHTLAHAAKLLLDEQISGAPVVDEQGRCLGVLSATSILAAEGKATLERQKAAESAFWTSGLALPASVYAAKLQEVRDRLVPAGEQPVARFMTTDLVTVSEDAALRTVVEAMIDAHVHRVLVVDADGRLRGLISTTDVLAALLRST